MRMLAVVLVMGCGFGSGKHSDDKPVDASDPDAPPPASPRKLVFDATGIATTLTNVPILVSLTPAQIDYAKVGNPATDLKFTADAATLPHEIEQWNPGGESIVWVRVPTITANSTDGSILMHFGAGEGAPNAVMVWQPSQYDVVMHMDPSLANSVSTAYAGAGTGLAQAPGQIGSALKFESSGDRRLTLAASNDLFSGWGMFTLELWLRADYGSPSDLPNVPNVVDKGGGSTVGSMLKQGTQGNEALFFRIESQFTTPRPILDTQVQPRTWHYIAYTFDGQTVHLYRDGVHVTSTTIGGYTLATVAAPFILGSATNAVAGLIDELRIAQYPKPDDWIRAQYKAMTRQLIRFTDP